MIKEIILWLWQLPQNCLGLLLLRPLQASYTGTYEGVRAYRTPWFLGVSLGKYIIVYSMHSRVLKHELGHSKQSLYLGPLYLPLVGVPSLFWNILTRLKVLSFESYFTRWPENWADHLGGVQR